jgi:hypothetical protein
MPVTVDDAGRRKARRCRGPREPEMRSRSTELTLLNLTAASLSAQRLKQVRQFIELSGEVPA